MSDGGGKRFEDDVGDGLWREFENCAQAVTLLYRNPSWRSLQTAAASTTQLYKSGLEHQKNAFEKGYAAGQQSFAKEIVGMRRHRELSLEDLWKVLTRVACSPERRRISRSPSPETTESHAINLFQEATALCIAPSVTCGQNVSELNSFLSGQLRSRRKRMHSPHHGSFKKLRRS